MTWLVLQFKLDVSTRSATAVSSDDASFDDELAVSLTVLSSAVSLMTSSSVSASSSSSGMTSHLLSTAFSLAAQGIQLNMELLTRPR